MSKKIGIVGAGTAGLHLALHLQMHNIEVTLYADKRVEDFRDMRLPNTVAHFSVTIDREKALGVNHWQTGEVGYFGHHYYIGLPEPLMFYGDLRSPSRAVDYRIYLPTLLQDFIDRGGNVEYRTIGPDDYSGLAAEHDLVVVSTGKGTGDMFPRIPELSPHTAPQRQLCVGIFKGIQQRPSRSVTMYFSPGAGEMIEIPTLTFNGMQNALVIENHPGGELEILAKTRYDDDPAAFKTLLLEKLAKHYPTCFERIDQAEFDLANSSLDILQGGVVPTVRQTSTVLEGGTIALALGDVQNTVDPVLGQGANAAAQAAWIVAEEIIANDVFDARFVEKVDNRRNDRVHAATRWTNAMMSNLENFPPEFGMFVGAAAQNPTVADVFTNNFNHPDAQWDIFSSPDRVAAFVKSASA